MNNSIEEFSQDEKDFLEWSGFNEGWEEYVKEIQVANKKSNDRLFRVVEKIKGRQFVRDFYKLMKFMKSPNARLRVVRCPTGQKMTDDRTNTISEIWVELKYTTGEMEGTVGIRVKENRWLQFAV
jgi:hypothetical protein